MLARLVQSSAEPPGSVRQLAVEAKPVRGRALVAVASAFSNFSMIAERSSRPSLMQSSHKRSASISTGMKRGRRH